MHPCIHFNTMLPDSIQLAVDAIDFCHVHLRLLAQLHVLGLQQPANPRNDETLARHGNLIGNSNSPDIVVQCIHLLLQLLLSVEGLVHSTHCLVHSMHCVVPLHVGLLHILIQRVHA